MAKKSGSLKAKRSATPAFWQISRKDKRFVVRTSPGPHPKSYSYPLLVVLRDVLGLTKTRREALSVLNSGKISVDGRVVKSEAFPVGLMDVIDLPDVGRSFRMVPHYGRLLPVEISSKEKEFKICIVKSKKSVGATKISYGLHDGRVIFPEAEVDIKPGDACIIKIPNQEFQGSFRLAKGSLALLIKGEKSGEVASIEDVKPGTYSRGSIATVRFADGTSSELPTNVLLPLGKQVPEITLTKSAAS
ncbi:MAG TPA: S4 domain-containing protein [Nitrososphaerales archaeon]|nr:S4 domain-containing protein [Nitrososphaerales archaeon]